MARGIVRTVDKLGRIVIPKEMRKQLEMVENVDKFDIYMDGDKIVLKKHYPACIFCNNIGDGVTYKDRIICNDCLKKLQAVSIEE